MKRRIFSILLVICMMISMMPVTSLAEEVAEDGHDHILAQDTQEEAVPVTEETVVETTGEVTEETTVEPTEEVTGETTEETTEEATKETTEETTVEETQEATQPVTEPEPVCTCESDDPAFHATNCPLYEAPENPQCFCAEKCQEPNPWCDICGFDISRCGGEDTAVTYEGCDHSVRATLGYVSGSGNSNTAAGEEDKYLLDGNPSTKWCGVFDNYENYVIFTADGPSVLTSYTLTTGADTGSEARHYRNWKAWTLYGSNSPDGDWTVIDEVTGAVLPMASNAVSDPFLVDPHTPYTYYKLVVNAIFWPGTTSHQMADITIKKSAIVNGVCSECNKPCPHEAWKDGKCIFCGTPCAHSSWQNNKCNTCGIVCSHGDILELTCVEGSAGYNDAENAASLFDGEQNTKWCSKFAAGETSVIFTPGKETVLKSYTLTTGADTGSENRHYRNWKDWILYGSNTPNDDASWTPIQVVNSADLPREDKATSRAYVVTAHDPYTHFKLVITAIESGDTQQMAELTATGSSFQNSVCQCGFTCQNHEYVDYACKTCGKACPHENGYTGGYCNDCDMLHDHTGETFENGAYTDCGYACSHTGVLSLHFVAGTGHNPWLLLDGRSDTSWWANHPMHGEDYVIFASSDPSVFSSYTLTATKYIPKESLWTSWTLYGSYNRDKNWTVIHQVEDTSLELDENRVSQTFTVEPHIPYPYYKLDLYEIESDYWEDEHYMAEITITGLRLENNTCVRCGFHCTEHSYKDGFCEDCIQEHDHSGETFTGGKGDSCGYVCPHLQYDDAYKCSLCKLACAHKFNGNTCEDCGFVCGHSVGYEKGNCKLCGTEHDHTDEGYTNGAHTICHKPCPHVEYNKETHKCTVCQMACSHEKGHTKGVCNACETDCDHTSGYSATGFCNTCEYYEPAPQNNDGVHQISNTGQLYWFAEQINSGSPSISAELTCNIDVSNAPTNGIWTPIAASEGYTGTLDGNGYTVDGIVVENEIGSGFYAHLSEGGVIKNLGLGPSCTVTGFDETGGICGVNRGTIDCCWYLGTVGPPLNYYHGAVDGIAGRNFGTIKNCWFNGKSNNNYVDGICKSTDNFPRNCYFGINGSNGSFATGEIAFKLQAGMNPTELVWGQNLDNGNPKDANPVLNGSQVYQVTDCQGNTYYSNSSSNGGHQFRSDGTCVCGAAECSHERTTRIIDDSNTHSDRCTICDYVTATEPHAFDLLTGLCDCGAKCTHNFENGTCANCQNVCTHDLINSKGKCPCGTYYPAKLVGDVYQIENNEQLHWFAMKVNAGSNTISGKLMEDIAVTGVWTPMNAYCGTFDGNGKTITGLYNLDSSKSNVGFFGTVDASGIVKNLRVKDAHFLGRLFVGAIAGQNKGTILNCAASATLSANTYIGGLVGQVLEGGSIANCYSTATVSATRDPGGIAGKITDNSTVTNCYYLSDADQSEAKTQAQFASGEVAYLLQGNQTSHVWGQTIGTETVPVLNGKMVYTTTGCPSGYTNTEGEEKDHTYIDGKCACGETVQGLTIIQQPTDSEAKLGERYCVEVQAVGEGLQYQWYMKNAGSKSFAKSSVTDNTYDDVMTKARADREVYCVITDAHGNKVTTDTVKLICLPGETLMITRQPENQAVKLGEQFNVTFDAVGDGLKYQWYFRPVGTETWHTSGQKDNSYDDVMTVARHNRELYCVVTDAWGNKVATDPIVTIMATAQYELAITKQPNDDSAKLGEDFCVTVEAQGDGLKYQWYWRNAGSEKWAKSGQRDNTYDDVMTKARHNREVKCVITDLWGSQVESEIVTITGIPEVPLAILSQPTDGSVTMGERYCVTVEAQGDNLTYTWYFKNPGATSWCKSGVTDNTYDDVMTKARADRQVYCVITDALGNRVTTDTVTLNVIK